MIATSSKRLHKGNKKEKIKQLIENNHLSNKELVKLLDIPDRSICSLRKLIGIKSDSPYTKKGGRCKYKEKELVGDFELGWCIGFFASDGNLSKNKKSKCAVNRLHINLSALDKDTLVKFCNNLIESFENKNIKHFIPKNSYSKNEQVTFWATLPKLEKNIKEVLEFQVKTYSLQIKIQEFNEKSEKFKIGFLRGVIDGDGHINSIYPGGSIVSASEKFIDNLQYFFGGRKTKHKSGNFWDLKFRKKELTELLKRGINDYPHSSMERKTKRLTKHANKINKISN